MSFLKDPQSVLDYGWDWTPWLDTGETITTATITPDPGITVQSQSNTTTGVTVWLAGGTDGTRYSIACRVTTSAGRTDERTIKVTVVNR
jgi:uncharacterized protein YebE (UPF0316 family)